jgi:osmoprotectant transport system ATP-binding protein
MPPVFELQGVHKRYGNTVAVKDVSMTVPGGETTALIGPSGCGKSTLLRLLVGLIELTEGEIAFEGEALAPERINEQRHKMGYVIQDGGLFPHMTARQNVTVLARHLGQEKAAISSRVDELAELTHFPKTGLDRYPAQLSGGQRQRVSLMRALMLDPDVLLLDEPLGALDPMIRADLQEELKEIFRKLEKTVVMVTHDLGEAAFFAHNIVLMRQGAIIQFGTLNDLVEKPADPFVSEFITAQRNTLDVSKVTNGGNG